MPSRFTSIVPVLLGVLIAEVALGMMTTLIPLDLAGQHVRDGVIGLVGSAYFLGFLIGTLTCARLVRAVGHIRAFAVFLAIAADCALLMTFTDRPMLWAALRLIMGWQLSGMFLVAESWLNDKTDNASRGRTFGAYLLVSWGGAALGPLAYGLLKSADRSLIVVGVVMTHTGVNGLFVFLAVMLLALSGFTLARIRKRPGVEIESTFVPARAAPPQLPELDAAPEHLPDS